MTLSHASAAHIARCLEKLTALHATRGDLADYPGAEVFRSSTLVEIIEGRFIVQYWRRADGTVSVDVRLAAGMVSRADREALLSLWEETAGALNLRRPQGSAVPSAAEFLARSRGAGVLHLTSD